MKRCGKCKQEKERSEFHKNRSNKDGLQARCKPCLLEYNNAIQRRPEVVARRAAYYQEHRERILWRDRQRKYGMTLADFKTRVEHQGGVCAICGEDGSSHGKGLGVDHNHATGAIRAILCGNCNSGLGHFRDSAHILRLAAQYLEKFD